MQVVAICRSFVLAKLREHGCGSTCAAGLHAAELFGVSVRVPAGQRSLLRCPDKVPPPASATLVYKRSRRKSLGQFTDRDMSCRWS